jgi:hypothetical protein
MGGMWRLLQVQWLLCGRRGGSCIGCMHLIQPLPQHQAICPPYSPTPPLLQDARVRLASVTALLALYSNPDNGAALADFTQRFAQRFGELFYDADERVAVKGVRGWGAEGMRGWLAGWLAGCSSRSGAMVAWWRDLCVLRCVRWACGRGGRGHQREQTLHQITVPAAHLQPLPCPCAYLSAACLPVLPT